MRRCVWSRNIKNRCSIYIYDSSLRVNGPSEPGLLRDVCVCQWVNSFWKISETFLCHWVSYLKEYQNSKLECLWPILCTQKVTLRVFFSCSQTNESHQFLEFILFCSSTLHISDGLSVHHQESKTVHTASGVRQTDSADYLLAGTRRSSISFPLASSQQNLFDIIPDAVCTVLDSWWWTERPSKTWNATTK